MILLVNDQVKSDQFIKSNIREIKIRAQDFAPQETVPDAYIDEQSLKELQKLAGVEPSVESMPGINISKSGMEKQKLERKHGIRPGTEEWFRLWFSLPYMTGEQPVKNKSK